MTHARARLCALIGSVLIAGCSVLAPRPDHSRFFTLTSVAPADTQPSRLGAPRQVTYGLGPVRMPPYLDRHEVATRLSPTEVAYSTTDRWAAPLDATMKSVLLQNLSTWLDADRVVPYPSADAVAIDYQIEVDVLRFDNDAAGTAQLTARWTVRNLRTAASVLARETTRSRPAAPRNASAAAAALSALLGELGEEIAMAVRQLPAPQAAPPPAQPRRT